MKIRRISEFQSRIHFPDFDNHFEKYMEAFQKTELGNIYKAVPWQEMVEVFDLKDKVKGPQSTFSPRGKIALMFLKNYSGCSDEKLIEQLNGNMFYQIFCDLLLEPGEGIENFKFVSQIRCELAMKLGIDRTEKVLINYWRPYMTNLECVTFDATCYESSIKYPTDVKLLWDSVVWTYDQIQGLCNKHKLRMPRTKYNKWVARGISYSKMKKKRKKRRRSLLRGLLRLLKKLTAIQDNLEQEYGNYSQRSQYLKRKQTIRKILEQQGDKFYKGVRQEMVEVFDLKDKVKGPQSTFSPRGKIALMFLKNYSGCSDEKLIEQLNGNMFYQIFCDLLLEPGEGIENFKFVSQIRCELAMKLGIDRTEKVLINYWRPYMTNLECVTFDATCYESSIKYPTDVKLLWDSVVWTYDQIQGLCNKHKLRMPRTKYNKWVARGISYSKMKKKRKKRRRSLLRGLLRLLKKLTAIQDNLEQEYGNYSQRSQYLKRKQTIRKILEQQGDKFYKGVRQEMVEVFDLKDKVKGPQSTFSPRGKIALMFLKNYSGCSDEKLIEQLNGNMFYQIFCDLLLEPGEGIENFKFVSQIRCELAMKLGIDRTEKVLINYWRPYMTNLECVTFDATCYESSIKYPTDVKLLWDSVVWTYDQIQGLCNKHKLRMPRTKYNKWVARGISYSKMKKKRKKRRRSLLRGLLRLLKKLTAIQDNLEQEYGNYSQRSQYLKRKQTIRKILEQQGDKFYKGVRQEMVEVFDLKDKVKGPQSTFSPRGKIALMFLKNYSGCSDEKLIEQLNGNMFYQIFCDLLLEPGEGIENFKFVSQIRCELAMKLGIDRTEKVLINYWRPYMTNLECVTFDATCYESSIKYPTDVKLLWDSVVWTYDQIQGLCNKHKLRMPRTKYNKWVARGISYSKMKKKRKKRRRSLLRGLLRLLKKLTAIQDNLEQEYGNYSQRSQYLKRKQTIRKILEQQGDKFYKGVRPKEAIVSIDKPHIRPIVRGKENKSVEFGAKLHKLQIDGISFIEHISFDAFHEGNRLEKTIWKAQSLTNKRVKLLGADAIYATNANRKYTTVRGIQTDFKPKGRPGRHKEHKSQLAKMITKERASRLEGSFGTDKEYFLLNKIKARTKQTEILWIFFGIHTSNAINIGRRMAKSIATAA